MKWTKTHITNQNNTSSTAQGSGGSFKDRKLIGVVCCCESWMAEQTHWWIERWLECRAIYLSICLPASLKAKLFWENPCVFDFDNQKRSNPAKLSLVPRLPRDMHLCAEYGVLFPYFDIENCFASQWLALFFNSSASRGWGVFGILTSKSASRHNGVQFFVSHLTRWLCTRRFTKPTFRHSGATNHWKNMVTRDFPTFFWLFLFSDLLSSSLLLSDSSHLCFPFVHIVGSLTSKLPQKI